MNQYSLENGLEFKGMKVIEFNKTFIFVLEKQYTSKKMGELPIVVQRMDGKEDIMTTFTYLVDAEVLFCVENEH